MIRDVLSELIQEHDEHMERTHELLIGGTPLEEMAVHYAYGAGLHKAISTIEVMVRSSNS